ncbi:tetratricopeptide repeat protein [Cellvibrio mixtus]|nr:tetratricopeptide repeat protein [Cellvibrio mixtus]
MKKIAQVAALSLGIALIGCGEDTSKNAETALRHQNSAKVYLQQGQLRAAMLEARNAIQLAPESADAYIALARILNDTGAYSSAITMLNNVVEQIPEVAAELAEANIEIKKYRTALDVMQNHPAPADNAALQYQQAYLTVKANIALGEKDAYTEALTLFSALPNSALDAKYLEANILLAQGQTEPAIVILNEIVAQDEKHLDALVLLGNLSLYENKLPAAEQYLTKALALVPNTDVITVERVKVLTQLTEVLIQQGRTSEAYTYQKLLADANPDRNVAQQKFNDAMELYQQGKFADAEKLLRELRSDYPDDKNTATLLGMVEFQQGADQNAIDLFDQFIDPETAAPSVIQAAALAKFRSNQMDDAIVLLKNAAERQPNNPSILATYGLALLDQDPTSSDGAIALEKSLALEPKQQRIRIALAKRYMAIDQPEQAIAQLQKAYEAQPMDLLVQQTYFKTLLANGLDKRAEEVLKGFDHQHQGSPRSAFLQGWFALYKKDYKTAEALFEKALSIKGNDEKQLSYAGLAQIYNEQDQPHKAVVAWQSIIELDPANLNSYRPWLAQIMRLNRAKEAVAFLEKLESTSNHWQPSAVLAQLLSTEKQNQAALVHLGRALEKSNNAHNVQQIAANLYTAYAGELLAADNTDEARNYLLKASALFPNNITYLAGLVETEIAAGKIPEAQKLLDQFERNTQSESGLLYLQGMIRAAEGKSDEAFSFYQQSWVAKPTELAADSIYKHFIAVDKKQQADAFVAEWLEKLPQSYRASLLKALDAQDKNDIPAAIEGYERALSNAPESPVLLNNLAWSYYLEKDPRAEQVAKKAYELAPNSPAILDTYGWILVESGKVSEGISYLERAANLAEGNAEIQQHLDEARARLKKQ